jgi:hypothetical protein
MSRHISVPGARESKLHPDSCDFVKPRQNTPYVKRNLKNYPYTYLAKSGGSGKKLQNFSSSKPVFLNRRAAARYRTLESILPGRERFSWNF